MIVDKLTKTMFYPFFRKVGNPYQKVIHNVREFERFVQENNGKHDVYVSVYDERKNIDKIFFDLDIMDIDIAYKFFTFLRENDLCVIPVFSGKKGFHFYVMLKGTKFTNEEAISWLKNVTYTLIDQSKMYKTIKNEITGEKIKVPLFDRRVIGDINRLTRVPNTLRPPDNLMYCCVLPEDFGEWDIEDLYYYAKHPHFFDNGEYKIIRKYRITQLPCEKDIVYDYMSVINSTSINTEYESDNNINISRLDTSITTFLKLLLRPCLYYWITMDEPPHEIRTAVTIDLLTLGFSPDEIICIFEKLKWRDYEYKITKYHVYHIANKMLKRYSCRKLSMLGFCIPECDKVNIYARYIKES